MKSYISFFVVAIAFMLLLSCKGTANCHASTDTELDPNPTDEVALVSTEVA